MFLLQNLSGLAKENYTGNVNETLNHASPVVAQIEQSTTDVVGLEVLLDVELNYHSGFGARGENENYPDGIPAQNVQPRWKLAKLVGRDVISKEVVKRSEADPVAFERAMDTVVRQLKKVLKHDFARQVYGTGDGVVAACGTTTSSTTVQLAATTPESTLLWIKRGFRIDIGTVASPSAVASNRTITSVDVANKRVVISGAAVTTAGTDRIFIAGSGGSTTFRAREINGFANIVRTTGALFGLDPATYPEWAALSDSNGGTPRTLSAALLQRINHNQIRGGASESSRRIFATTHGVFRAFAAVEAAKVRYVSGEQGNLRAGVEGIEAGGHTVVADQYCPDASGYSLDLDPESGLRFAVNGDWEFEEEGGNIFGRLPGTDTYEVLLNRFIDLVTVQRNTHTVVTDLSES